MTQFGFTLKLQSHSFVSLGWKLVWDCSLTFYESLGIFVMGWDGSPELKMFVICFSTLCWCVLFHRRTLDFHGWKDTLPPPTMCSTPFTVETLAKDFCHYFERFLSFSSSLFPFFSNIGVRSCLWTEVTASVKLYQWCKLQLRDFKLWWTFPLSTSGCGPEMRNSSWTFPTRKPARGKVKTCLMCHVLSGETDITQPPKGRQQQQLHQCIRAVCVWKTCSYCTKLSRTSCLER